MPLNDAKCKAAKAGERPYKLTDSGQLYLHVTTAGGKHWRMNYVFGGKQRTLTIGPYPIVTLGDARDRRDTAKRQLLDGRDPSLEKQAASRSKAIAAANTFQAVAESWFELKSGWSLERLDAWREKHGAARLRDADNWSDPRRRPWSLVHSDDVLKSLRRDLIPKLGKLPIAAIDTPTVLDAIHAVEKRGAIETGHRARQRASDIFVFGIASGLCALDPAASLRKALREKPRAKKQPAIIDRLKTNDERLAAVRGLLADCDAQRCRASTKLALRLLALTAVRPGEVGGARWSEFEDLDGAEPLWRIPAARMKGDKDRKAEDDGDHLVPLSRQAVELLEVLWPLSGHYDLVFPGERHPHHTISENTLRAVLIRAGYHQRHVPHGFRATFSTIMNERAKELGRDSDRAVIDLMLAHVPKDKVEGAYNRAAYMPRRRALAQEWADLLLEGAAAPDSFIGQPIRWAAKGPRELASNSP